MPAPYSLQGGVKAFLSCLRQHAPLLRSADDPSTFLVNDTADPLQRSLWCAAAPGRGTHGASVLCWPHACASASQGCAQRFAGH